MGAICAFTYKHHQANIYVLILGSCMSCLLPKVLVAQSRNKLPLRNLRMLQLHHFVALYCLMVFIHGTQVSPSSGRVKTKKASVQILASCRSCVLHNLLVARSRNKLPHYILWAGPGCNYIA